ncbi:MAG: hypothetical protein U5S82_14760 [Gammaproteobacteria bacterium]|nr:hypothetical protein [Gammaproteobacteria bacterium]
MKVEDGDYYRFSPRTGKIYGYGENHNEAVEALKDQIESVYEDLMEDDLFTNDWLVVKEYLKGIVVDE